MTKNAIAMVMALLLAACSSEAEDQQAAENPWTAQAGGAGQSQAPSQDSAEDEEGEDGEDGESAPRHPAADPPRKSGNFGNCTHMFPGGIPPRIVNPEYANAITPKYDEVCYRAFALGHSGLTRTAIWSSEVLDPQRMKMASGIDRDSSFEADPQIAEDRRSELDDYRRSGYDRGHLAPSADMPSREAQQESFRLSNIVPQEGSMNGGVWRELEMNVRREAWKGKVYVTTGPIFENANKALRKRVLVPTALYKAMFTVDKGAVVFVISNDKAADTRTLSLEQFATIYGIDPFPALTGLVRRHNIALGPIPEQAIAADRDDARSGSSSGRKECREFQSDSGTWYKEDFFKMTYGSDATPRGIRPCQTR
ncbi:DNA/RNA non-specific endonuclease [uncultured Salinicola sp.]|uniref:DNA/RNA non-specific endonuclease n=1 Tax=uncultured Salinicola sp. TaxID=1193542 RepID=UPI00261038C1|nr:DNA/RNA non-specific endonuclease [uncultured Salinicola sp.]|tara:strand:- start:3396 stop:4496 length:1101 start_codon:yes stop_codon:yes gene_type:complete